ncbi:MAG: hypothetical protein V3U71_04045 [Cocleimonas sp.]
MYENMAKALDILAEQPIPDDARERIDKLYDDSDEEEKEGFSKVYEGLFLHENQI